jgi:hypothetical protein
MRQEFVSFAAIKQGVPMKAVLEHYRIQGLRGGRAVSRICVRCVCSSCRKARSRTNCQRGSCASC